MVMIEFLTTTATIDGRVWTSNNGDVARFLNNVSILDTPTSDPFPDMTIAHQIVNQFGGRIIETREPVFTDGRVY